MACDDFVWKASGERWDTLGCCSACHNDQELGYGTHVTLSGEDIERAKAAGIPGCPERAEDAVDGYVWDIRACCGVYSEYKDGHLEFAPLEA